MNFKDKVYKIVKKIPKGKTLSYKEVAEKAGKLRAWRADRVIRSNGKIGGYNKGEKKKLMLLKKEGAKLL